MVDPFASDLNPVAYFILRVMLEDIPCPRAWPGRPVYGPPSRTSRPPRTFPSERSDARLKGQRGLMASGRGSSAQDLVFNVNYSCRNCAD